MGGLPGGGRAGAERAEVAVGVHADHGLDSRDQLGRVMTAGDVRDGALDPRVVEPGLQPRNDLPVADRRLHESQQLRRQTRRERRRRLGLVLALPFPRGNIGRASEVGEGAAHRARSWSRSRAPPAMDARKAARGLSRARRPRGR
jgi:hypothetical protein